MDPYWFEATQDYVAALISIMGTLSFLLWVLERRPGRPH